MIAALGAVLATTGQQGADAQSASTTGSDKLRWAPPLLTNPTTLTVTDGSDIGNGARQFELDTSRDYIIDLPNAKQVGGLWIDGGRNIHIIGGYITANPDKSTDNSDSRNRAIYIKGATGTVHIEGVSIDDSAGGQSDAIGISAPSAIVQVENVRVERISGRGDEIHADIIALFGDIGELRVDKLTGFSNYQGLFYVGRGPTIAQRANVGYRASPYVDDYGGGHFLWLTSGSTSCTTAGHTMSEIYVHPEPGRVLSESVWPTTYSPSACKASVLNNEATWPNLASVSGSARLGPPLNGDFVPAGVAGTSYVSPGYE